MKIICHKHLNDADVSKISAVCIHFHKYNKEFQLYADDESETNCIAMNKITGNQRHVVDIYDVY